jgi:ketosteroid isomerase-like protein
MSQENVEIVRSAFEDFGQGDMASLLAKVDPDIVIVQPRELGGATQRGHAGVHEAFALWPEQWDNYEATITNTIDVGEQVVVAVRTTGRSRATGLDLTADFSFVMTLRDGKITSWRLFLHDDEALEAAGLSE